MDAPVIPARRTLRHPLLFTALAPLVPHILGSIFNIWYNAVIIAPLIRASGLQDRFVNTIIVWNSLVYPIALAVWLRRIFSIGKVYHKLMRAEPVPEDELQLARRRVINLPWYGAGISAVGWLLGAPVFLLSFVASGHTVPPQLYWHFPISFIVSGFIAITQAFFMVELFTHWGLFPVFFHEARAHRLKGTYPISLRLRGILWAISAGICPIGSLLLLIFAPPAPGANPQWFGLFVGTIGIAFGLCSAVLIGRSVAEPVHQLRAAAEAVTDGRLDVEVPLRRADEFGELISEFNRMITGLREKERLRKSFGLHVGRKAAEHILAHDPGLGGTEQDITVMFVDIRSFTARSSHLQPHEAVKLLNEFLQAMVEVVEGEHGGMINKFLGDGFMAIFGIGSSADSHADRAVEAAKGMERALERLNVERTQRGEDPLGIGIGINTGPAIVGSIGSSERMEFTVIGNTVNVASRIESLNKTMATSVLLSRSTFDALHRNFHLKALAPQPVKGVDEPVAIFTFDA